LLLALLYRGFFAYDRHDDRSTMHAASFRGSIIAPLGDWEHIVSLDESQLGAAAQLERAIGTNPCEAA
jgi:hypothetical protein